MIRLAVVVEGETEEEFVKCVLSPHLRMYGVEVTPHLLRGNVTVERLAAEMANLFWSYDRVTSLVDFYGFRDKEKVTRDELETRIHEQVSLRIKRNWDKSRVFPYVQQYEFEGLLFSDVTVFGKLLDRPPELVEKLKAIRSRFPTPEEINDTMGLSSIRAECPRFAKWIARLEGVQQQQLPQ